jgi:hypothetical protein
MAHPLYGVTHAYNDKQVAELEKRGFVAEEEKARPTLTLPAKPGRPLKKK